MRFVLPLFLLFTVATACNSGNRQTADEAPPVKDTAIADEYSNEPDEPAPIEPKAAALFPQLFSYFSAQDTAFHADGFEALVPEKDSSATGPLDRNALRPFLPYLVYNRDSSLAIDYVSTNFVLRTKGGKQQLAFGGPDTEVQLIDFAKGTRQRILFLGTMGYVCDVAWQDENRLLIAGAEQAENGMIPMIWRYDTRARILEQLRYPQPLRIDVTDYAEKELNAQATKTSPSF
jgi:hypothetical protein